MGENRLWRATYDAERDSWLVEDAGYINGEPVIEYLFSCNMGRQMGTLSCG